LGAKRSRYSVHSAKIGSSAYL